MFLEYLLQFLWLILARCVWQGKWCELICSPKTSVKKTRAVKTTFWTTSTGMVERWATGHLQFTVGCTDIRSTLRRGHNAVSDIHDSLGGGRTNPHVSSLRRQCARELFVQICSYKSQALGTGRGAELLNPMSLAIIKQIKTSTIYVQSSASSKQSTTPTCPSQKCVRIVSTFLATKKISRGRRASATPETVSKSDHCLESFLCRG